MLLILDNFEHLLSGIRLVEELVHAAPEIKLLVTSREKLKLQSEQLFPIAGLTYPQEGEPLDQMQQYSAIELFVQCALRVRPQFQQTVLNRSAIAAICCMVEGMPLGIVLAAAWLDTLTPAEIAREIGRDLDFLVTEISDVPGRQRSLHAAFNHSWRLLSEQEQDIYRQLSVLQRHEPHWRSSRQLETLQTLSLEADNITAAFRFALDFSEWERMAGAFDSWAMFHEWRGLWVEAQAFCQAVVERLAASPKEDLSRTADSFILWTKSLAWQGCFCSANDEALLIFERCLTLLKRPEFAVGDVRAIEASINRQPADRFFAMDHLSARGYAEESLRFYQEQDNHWCVADIKSFLARLDMVTGHYQQARERAGAASLFFAIWVICEYSSGQPSPWSGSKSSLEAWIFPCDTTMKRWTSAGR